MKGVTNAKSALTSGVGFQSTLPMKGVTWILLNYQIVEAFQSTLPMKGVTQEWRARERDDDVSIHTPNEGSDSGERDPVLCDRGFNPHSQ